MERNLIYLLVLLLLLQFNVIANNKSTLVCPCRPTDTSTRASVFVASNDMAENMCKNTSTHNHHLYSLGEHDKCPLLGTTISTL